MENEILQAIKHIKDVSRKKATIGKIETFIKKNNMEILTDELNNVIDNMVKNGVIVRKGDDKNAAYSYPEKSTANEEHMDVAVDSQREDDAEQHSEYDGVEETQVVQEEDTHQNNTDQSIVNNDLVSVSIFNKEITSFKIFQETVEMKLSELEKALNSRKINSGDTIIDNNESGDESDGKSDFMFKLLKNRITTLENEISKKDAIIAHLTQQLFLTNSTSHTNKKAVKTNENKIVENTPLYDESSHQDNRKKKVTITGDSMLNGINERGLSKHQKVKVKNFSGGTGETIVENLDNLIDDKPDCLIIHAGTNDITKGINTLNCAKKILKKVKQVSPNTKVVFSSLITRKDKKDLDKKVVEVNGRLKNFCSQKNIDFIENTNLKEEHLGNKKLHLNKRGNTVFASNLLKYLRSAF